MAANGAARKTFPSEGPAEIVNSRIASPAGESQFPVAASDTMSGGRDNAELANEDIFLSDKVVEELEQSQRSSAHGRMSPSAQQETQTVPNKSYSEEESVSSSAGGDDEKRTHPSARFLCIGAILTILMIAVTFVGVLVVFMKSEDNLGTVGSDVAQPQAPQEVTPQTQPAPTPSLRTTTLVPSLSPSIMPLQNGVTTGAPVSQWLQKGTDIRGDPTGGLHSWAVSLSRDGTTLAVGAWADAGSEINAGRTRVHRYSTDSGWTQLGEDIDGESDGDFSGWALSISGDGSTVAIGSHGSDGDKSDMIDVGQVRVFQWDGSEWAKLGNTIQGDSQFDLFGYAVSLSSDGLALAIGAPHLANDSAAGQVKVFRYDEGSKLWSQEGKSLTGQMFQDEFGHSVSINEDGSSLAVGIPGSNATGVRSGHVEVYSFENDDWVIVGSPLVNGRETSEFGFSVSLVGNATQPNTLAIGSPNADALGGDVRIFFWIGIAWLQLGNSFGGTGAGDLFGYSVSLSADGQTVAVGSPGSDSSSGYTEVRRWNGAEWQQLGGEFRGREGGDSLGRAVSLSSDGSRIAIGAVSAFGNSSSLGYTQVYDFKGGSMYT